MKKVVVLLLLAVFLVVPVSASDQFNYWNTAYLSTAVTSQADIAINGQDIVVTSKVSGSSVRAYGYYKGSQFEYLFGRTLVFSFSSVSTTDYPGSGRIEFYLNGNFISGHSTRGAPIHIDAPEEFDQIRFQFFVSYYSPVEVGDSVTFTDIKLMVDRDINTDTFFTATVGSVFGFLGTVSSGLLNVVFSYKFMAAAILMPFFVWIVLRVIRWFRGFEPADIKVPDLRGRFSLKRLDRKLRSGRTVKIDGRYYLISPRKKGASIERKAR